VTSVEQITPHKGMGYGIHLLLKTEKETISVHLGPGWYVEHQEMTMHPKDRIEVKGSRITFDGRPAIIAAEVRKGDETLVLRDEKGSPCGPGRGGVGSAARLTVRGTRRARGVHQRCRRHGLPVSHHAHDSVNES